MNWLARKTALPARHAWLWLNRNSLANADRNGAPRLLVDVSAILRHDAQTGIQRVVRAVWSELRRRSDCGFGLVPVYASQSHGYCYAPADCLQRSEPLSRQPVSAGPKDIFLGLDLSAHLLPHYRRQLRAWRRNGATVSIIVYDMLPLTRPEWFSPRAVGHFRRWFNVVRTETDQALCISDQVARELRQELALTGGTDLPRVGRLQMGGDITASLPSMGITEDTRQLLDGLRFRPAILMVGTIEPRKGHDIALDAFEHLWETRPGRAPDLIVVGKAGWKTERLQDRIRSHPQFGRRLHWLNTVSDEALCGFYDGCRGVFMASRGEGFGLPLIEAAAHHRFVLARDLAVYREQQLPNVLYFDNDRPAALGDRLMDLLGAGQRGAAPTVDLPTWGHSVDALLVELGMHGRERQAA